MSAPFNHLIGSPDELARLYGAPSELVVSKVIDRLDGHCRNFIARTPFVLVATSTADGRCDVSPKGGPPGFVAILDEKRLAVPDAPGNRLIDSLRNIVDAGRAGLLFVIPGVEETLRVNGRAFLTRDPAVLELFTGESKQPKLAIGIEVEEVFLHCAKAFKRSQLWDPPTWPDRSELTPAAEIWRDHMALADLTTERVQEMADDDYANNLTWT